jgi:nucleotide-binding universal stress UspA family protein
MEVCFEQRGAKTMIKRILLGIGGTPFTAVGIEQAVEIASRNDARLTAVTVVDPNNICKFGPVPAGAGIYAKRMCDNRMEITKDQIGDAVAALEKNAKQAGVRYEVEWETGDPFALMIDHSRYHDLTIFGLRSLFDYQLVEKPEKDLLQLLSCGVRPILAVSDHYRPIHRVMIAYSGSMESAKAMRRFVQCRLWPDATLDIVHFSEKPDDSNALLKDAAAYCRDHGFTVSNRLILGKAHDQMLATAREMDADMIVMGNSIRSIWLRKVLGDTVTKTLTQADRAIFLSQ